MKRYRAHSRLAVAALLGTTALLTACGGGGNSNGTPVTGGVSCPAGSTVCGTAATGAPLASASIVLHCKNNWNEGTSTDANGLWSFNVPAGNLPCAVKATKGGDTYYAFTQGTGGNITTNLSPLTSLALAQALGAAPDDAWFNGVNTPSNAGLDAMAAALPDAIAALNTALAGYALPAGFNPISTPLTAATGSQPGNEHDHLLEQFGAALGGGDFASLLASFAGYDAENDAPPLPAPSYTPGVSTRTAFFETFAGDYTLKVTGSGAEGNNNAAARNLFPQDHAITVHLKSNGDVMIDAVGRSLTWAAATYNGNTGVGKWAEFDGTATTLNTVRYRNGTTLDLYITYDPATGKLQVDPQGFVSNEGYASLKGSLFIPVAGDDDSDTGSTPPTLAGFTPAAGAVGTTVTLTGTGFSTTLADNVVRFTGSTGTGIPATVMSGSATQLVVTVPVGAQTGPLTVYNGVAVATLSDTFTVDTAGGDAPVGPLGNAIRNVWAGDYALKCATAPVGGTTQTFAVTIQPNGDAMLDGEPLVDATHPGNYNLTRFANDNSTTLRIAPTATNSNYVVLGFKGDGSFYPNSLNKGGTTYYCYTYAGHTAPAASSAYVPTSAVGALARRETLNCTQDGTTEPRTLAINSDGSAQLGTLSFTNANITNIWHNHHEAANLATNKLEYSLVGGGTYNQLTVAFQADLSTKNAYGAVGTGMNDGISCLP